MTEAESREKFETWAIQNKWNTPILWSMRDALYEVWKAAIATQTTPAAFKLVPIEATPEMLLQGREVFGEFIEDSDNDFKRIYRAMLFAAPKP